MSAFGMQRSVLLTWLCVLALGASAQSTVTVHLKHRVFLNWGYNRAQFTNSNIHFTGPGYDFILHNVVADDKPEPFSFGNYFNPKNIWIPQYNYRAGWFLSDRWSFSIGLDHMKYVMRNDQDVRITGTISEQRSTQYAGNEESTVKLTSDFLRYEHTDGLNLLSADADHYDHLLTSANGKHAVFLTEGLFIGPVIPRTDVRLFGEGINNKFHLAGYGAGAQLGLFAVLSDRLFLRAAAKAGYIELPSVLTTGTSEDRARQRFWFVQEYAVLGVLIGK
jgi:hypothetical protein